MVKRMLLMGLIALTAGAALSTRPAFAAQKDKTEDNFRPENDPEGSRYKLIDADKEQDEFERKAKHADESLHKTDTPNTSNTYSKENDNRYILGGQNAAGETNKESQEGK